MSNVRVNVNAVEMDASIDSESIWESVFEKVGDLVKEEAWDVVSEQVRDTIGEEAWEAVSYSVESFCDDYIPTCVEDAVSVARHDDHISEVIGSLLGDFTRVSRFGLCSVGEAFQTAVETATDNIAKNRGASEEETVDLGLVKVLEQRVARLETLLRRFGEDVDDRMGTNAHPQVVSTEPF